VKGVQDFWAALVLIAGGIVFGFSLFMEFSHAHF